MKLILAVVTVALAGLIWLLLSPARLVDDAQRTFTSPAVAAINGPVTVGQSFVARYPGLTSVAFLIGTNARKNTAPLVFHLRDLDAGRDIVQETLSPRDFADNHFATFSFKPIPDSSGRAYQATLAAPTAGSHEGITVWADRQAVLSQGTLYVSGQSASGDLAFRLGYEAPRLAIARALLDRLSQRKPGPFGTPIFVIATAIVELALAGRLVWRLRQEDQ